VINPRSPRKSAPASATPKPPVAGYGQPPQQDVPRGQAIFDDSEEAKPFLPGDFDFAMNDEAGMEDAAPASASPSLEASPAQPLPSPRPKPRARRILGMTPIQLVIVIALALLLLCLVVGLAAFYFGFLRP
jgi:hypothetical protein